MKSKLLLLILLLLLPLNVQADVAGCDDTTGMSAASNTFSAGDALNGVSFAPSTGGTLDSLTFLIANNGVSAGVDFMIVLYHLGAEDTTAIDSSGTHEANANSDVEFYSFPAINGVTIIADSSYLITIHADDPGGVRLKIVYIIGTSLCPDLLTDGTMSDNAQATTWDGTVPLSSEFGGAWTGAIYYAGYITYTEESAGQIIMIENN